VLRTITLGLLLAGAALAPARAAAQRDGRFSARAEIGGSLGVADVGVAAVAWRATVAWRPLVLEWSTDFGGYIDGGPRSYDLSVLGGAGTTFAAGSRWRGAVLLVGGLHSFGTEERGGPGYHDHGLPAAGVRVGFTITPERRRLFFPSLTLAATATADLRREYDFFLDREVGGYAVVVSATAGIGFAPRARAPRAATPSVRDEKAPATSP
jgi:hypothetical protein